MSIRTGEDGTTLIEMIVAAALTAAVTGVVLQLLLGGHTAFVVEPERADMQQRLRVALDLIAADVRAAGAGLTRGDAPVSLWNLLPAIRPARRGLIARDGEMAAFADRLTVLFAPPSAIQAPLGRTMTSRLDDLWIDGASVGCAAGRACGLRAGTRMLVLDVGGVGHGYDLFTVQGTRGDGLVHAPPGAGLSRRYPRAGAWVTEVTQRAYYRDVATDRLMRYDGYRSDQPVIDHVVDFEVAFYADPSPFSVPPPPPGQASCVYDAGDPPRPLLDDLGGDTPRRLSLDQMTDGPMCGLSPNRFDGDLLRVRRIRLTLRVRTASEHLRAPAEDAPEPAERAGPAIEDYEVSLDVAPRVQGGRLGPSLQTPVDGQ